MKLSMKGKCIVYSSYSGNATCTDPEFCFEFSYYDDFENASLNYDRYDENIVSTFSSRN